MLEEMAQLSSAKFDGELSLGRPFYTTRFTIEKARLISASQKPAPKYFFRFPFLPLVRGAVHALGKVNSSKTLLRKAIATLGDEDINPSNSISFSPFHLVDRTLKDPSPLFKILLGLLMSSCSILEKFA